MTENDASNLGCPAEILDWIPWYPGPGLSEAQKGAVESHAAECARCRQELALLAGKERIDLEVLPPAQAVYARVLARIADEKAGFDAANLGGTPPAHRLLKVEARRHGSQILSYWREAVVVAAAAAAAGVAFGWISGHSVAQPVYESAAAVEALVGGVVAVDVIYRDDVTAQQIHVALRALGAHVVSGPNGAGVMRLELPPQSDAVAAARLLTAEPGGIARFAEPALLEEAELR
jgi:hypothetical protein